MNPDSTNQPAPRFSLVIPAYNEAAYLPRLLDTIDAARARYRGGAEAVEVIVADDASTDRTAEIARARGCVVQFVEKRVIAASRNGGARAARGEFLCFCDADMRIHPETFNVIEDRMDSGKVVAGATGVRLERMSLGLAVTYALMVPMVWVMKMDTGVVFCRREDYLAIGGYNEEKIFAEDVQFLMDLRRLGKSRGQNLCRATEAKALSSTRKWDKHGEWHQLRMMFLYLIMRPFNANVMDDFAKRYWYDDPR
ncbi:glycosyltransferase [Candidatus Sumerlaeota bacterium]|nr:glycosyltransferase [Candidatus Sumerlaeota bacterium]